MEVVVKAIPWVLIFIFAFCFMYILHKRFTENNVWGKLVKKYKDNVDAKVLSEAEFVTRFGAIENNSLLYKLDRLMLVSGIKNRFKFVNGEVFLGSIIVAAVAGFFEGTVIFQNGLVGIFLACAQAVVLYGIAMALAGKTYNQIEDNTAIFISILSNHAKGSSDIVTIFQNTIPSLSGPLKRIAEKFVMDAENTGNVDIAFDYMKESVDNNQILGTRRKIAAKEHMDIYLVTPEMIFNEKPEYSVKDIKAVLDYLDGRMSVEQMLEEDGMEGEAFEDKSHDGPDLKNEVVDINVQKFFDLFLGKMSDLEKFFALIEIGCSDKYASMTVSQLSVDPVFLNIVEADSKYAKNIAVGDVVIKRPDRHSYNDRDIELKDVKYVGGTVVRYQREQTRLRWTKLREVLTEDDILGNKSVEYFVEIWKSLMKKYSE